MSMDELNRLSELLLHTNVIFDHVFFFNYHRKDYPHLDVSDGEGVDDTGAGVNR